jgi:hypothetical protein
MGRALDWLSIKNRWLAAVFAAATPATTTTTTTATAFSPAVTTTTAAAASITAAASAGTIFARTRLVDSEGTAVKAVAVQRLHGSIGTFLIFHGHKGESARTPGELIHDHIDFENGAMGGKHILKLVFGCVEGKISHKQFRTHDDYLIFDYPLPYQLFPTVGFQIITEARSTEDPPDLIGE